MAHLASGARLDDPSRGYPEDALVGDCEDEKGTEVTAAETTATTTTKEDDDDDDTSVGWYPRNPRR